MGIQKAFRFNLLQKVCPLTTAQSHCEQWEISFMVVSIGDIKLPSHILLTALYLVVCRTVSLKMMLHEYQLSSVIFAKCLSPEVELVVSAYLPQSGNFHEFLSRLHMRKHRLIPPLHLFCWNYIWSWVSMKLHHWRITWVDCTKMSIQARVTIQIHPIRFIPFLPWLHGFPAWIR